jgi:hypothetical protein
VKVPVVFGWSVAAAGKVPSASNAVAMPKSWTGCIENPGNRSLLLYHEAALFRRVHHYRLLLSAIFTTNIPDVGRSLDFIKLTLCARFLHG